MARLPQVSIYSVVAAGEASLPLGEDHDHWRYADSGCTWGTGRSRAQPWSGVQRGGTGGPWPDRAPAGRGADAGTASGTGLPPAAAAGQRPSQERLSGATARPQRDPLL